MPSVMSMDAIIRSPSGDIIKLNQFAKNLQDMAKSCDPGQDNKLFSSLQNIFPFSATSCHFFFLSTVFF